MAAGERGQRCLNAVRIRLHEGWVGRLRGRKELDLEVSEC
jgi:hypothetical protein